LKTLLVGGMTGRWGSREESIIFPAEWGRGSLRGWESVEDRKGGSIYPCRQVLTCGGVWKGGDVRGCKGLADRVGVCRGDSPDGVTDSFHSLHDSVKEFLGWML
jgi:hypothetical protein